MPTVIDVLESNIKSSNSMVHIPGTISPGSFTVVSQTLGMYAGTVRYGVMLNFTMYTVPFRLDGKFPAHYDEQESHAMCIVWLAL